MEQNEGLAAVEAVISRTQYQTIITGGKHAIIADEPESLQGTDTGLSPNQLLLASLGSCKAITLQMYINRKMWVVDEIRIKLNLYPAQLDTRITSEITFKGDLTEEQRNRLIQIADKCPVQKMLTGVIVVDTVDKTV